MNKQPIGVYDSGIGGLTVLTTLQRLFPHENFIYFADTLHLPYGSKTKEQIIDYSRNILCWLQSEKKVKLVVAACHTSSAVALDSLSAQFTIPIVGTIHPLLKTLLETCSTKRIGLIATPASVSSKTHEVIFKQQGFSGHVQSIACPDFVPLLEDYHRDSLSSTLDSLPLRTAAKKYLEAFETNNLDTLIYGCTHYPFIRNIIESILPPSTTYIDPAIAIAESVKILLEENELLNDSSLEGKIYYHCSDNLANFKEKIIYFTPDKSPHVSESNIHSDSVFIQKAV